MKLSVAVLIAAVAVNCLVTAINGKAASNTVPVPVPYIDMLLPPLEDVNANTAVAVGKTKTTTSVTKKPITNKLKNIVPELSNEALLPPLFEANAVQEESTATKKPSKTIATTTVRPITTTQKPSTTTTNKPTTIRTTTTTLKPSKIQVPDLLLEPLLPPLLSNDIEEPKPDNIVATTQQPVLFFKTTKKSYAQSQSQQQQQQQQLQQQKPLKPKSNIHTKTATTLNNSATVKHVAESRIQTKQVPLLTTQPKMVKLLETMTKQHVAKQVKQHTQNGSNGEYADNKQYNYSFDLYFGSTTARPPKSGLPTITPFPHRLGR